MIRLAFRAAVVLSAAACSEVDPELFMFHMKFADRDHLQAVADRRHEMFTTEGRAARTSWERSGGDMVDLLDEITADIDHDDIRPFGPPLKKLPAIVEQSAPDVWRAVGGGQVQAEGAEQQRVRGDE